MPKGSEHPPEPRSREEAFAIVAHDHVFARDAEVAHHLGEIGRAWHHVRQRRRVVRRVDVVEDGFSWRGRADAPQLNGCLARVVRAFVRDRLGSALRLLADVLAALDDDLRRLAKF